MLTVGVDEVGYGPRLGPLVVAAAGALGRFRASVPIADSKRIFSQARGVGTLEPAVLGFVPATTFHELMTRLSCRLPSAPWYRDALPLPATPSAGRLAEARVRLVEPTEFNASTRAQNKAEFLFEVTAALVNEIRRTHDGPIRFILGKHGGRTFYREHIRRLIHAQVEAREETHGRSTYAIPGATLTFLRDAEDRHRLVALASMIGKYVRECAMRLFNEFWARRLEGLRRTAGYGRDATRFYREIEARLGELELAPESILRLR